MIGYECKVTQRLNKTYHVLVRFAHFKLNLDENYFPFRDGILMIVRDEERGHHDIF